MAGTRFVVEIRPNIPDQIKGLAELADDLVYSWDRQARRLFRHLDRELWNACNHNPKVFLRRVSQDVLDDAASDAQFMEEYSRTLSAYNNYHRAAPHPRVEENLPADQDLVAYFCAEFGFHESLPIYSGGLGILAGDHCKAASDLKLPFVAVGLLYRKGYFQQQIDRDGHQQAHYSDSQFEDLPISPVIADERPLCVTVPISERDVSLQVWKVKAGHVTLYLLDSDHPDNDPAERTITNQLYGGGSDTRIQQEICLGIGGVRALRALGYKPTVWHVNEGHAAFQILERARENLRFGAGFDAALESVAASTVFTTHTPVPAGHDRFPHEMVTHFLGTYLNNASIDPRTFLALGEHPGDDRFNMTAFALRGSRFHNGVSEIHGRVASRMESYVWPQVPPEENPITSVTNGVHVPTFMAMECANMLDMTIGREWRNRLLEQDFWKCIHDIPDHRYWSLRQSLKAALLEDMRHRVLRQFRRNGCSEAHISRAVKRLSSHHSDVLILGFARRFATYKRATLMFTDRDRLARLLNDEDRPMIIVFAGKAHPQDEPGQDLIREINAHAMHPDFEGRLFMLENYDLSLARKMLAGVDVWINNPLYPLEASGTSGQKAALNGAINLSVLDGWWGEGYDGANGWAITPHGQDFDPGYRDREEGFELLHTLESEVVPLYYERNGQGYPTKWVEKSKASMSSVLPRFNAQRMVMDYVTRLYAPASRHGRKLTCGEDHSARELADWKHRVLSAWPKVSLARIDTPATHIQHGEMLPIRVRASLNGLSPDDVIVECLVGEDQDGEWSVDEEHRLDAETETMGNDLVFSAELPLVKPGLRTYQLRMRPYHNGQAHDLELGRIIWV